MGMYFTVGNGVYPSSLGFTLNFDDPKAMPGLHGIFYAVGNMSVALLLSAMSHITNRIGRYPSVVVATAVSLCCQALVIVNIPRDAPFEDTTTDAYISPSNEYLAIFCSLLMGITYGCYNTQAITALGSVYHDKASEAFALFRLVLNLSVGVGFAYSGVLPLDWHMGVLAFACIAGTACFIKVDIDSIKQKNWWMV